MGLNEQRLWETNYYSKQKTITPNKLTNHETTIESQI